jgi:hypothetical protein
MTVKFDMDFENTMHFIAQGTINISEGHQVIEEGSLVHRAMGSLCELVNTGKVAERGPIPDAHVVLGNAQVYQCRDGSGRWHVVHPSNDAILAYCETEEAANAVRDMLNAISCRDR